MWRKRFQLTLVLLLSFAFPLFASGPAGTITGTITDPSGAVIPKARIVVRNEGTNATREAQSNGEGDYTVALLAPGRYSVAVESTGFRRSVIHGVILDVDQTVRVDFALVVGAASESVIVNETPPIIQTETSTLGQVVNNRLVQDLPLNERNFLSFALLVPGSELPTQGSQNSTLGGSINVNGARDQANNFLLEGVDNTDSFINQYVALPSIDAIQEFKVQSGDYSAEFGRASGAEVNVVLKSGTNSFHGGVFEFVRNRHMDAKNYFDLPDCTASSAPGTCGPIPRLDRNQFGGTLGGPIRKDKTFFFFSDEQLRLRQATTREATVPSVNQWANACALGEEIGGNPTPNPATCNIATSMYLNPAGQAVYGLYPAANVGTDLTDSNTYLSAPVIRESLNLISAKVDEQASPADALSIHYSVRDENRFDPFDPLNAFTSLPGYGSYTMNFGQNAGVDWTRVIRSSMVNEFRLGYNRMGVTVLQQSHGENIEEQLGFPDVLTNPVDLGAPNINLSGNLNGSQISFDGIGEPVNYPQNRRDNTYQISDNLAWTVGINQLNIGGDLRRIQIGNYLDFLARGDWFFGGQTMAGILSELKAMGVINNPTPCTGAPPNDPATCVLGQLLIGAPDYAIAVSGSTFNDIGSHGVSAYIQDDIHVMPRFLVNAGLRYEYNSPLVEAHNHFSVPDLVFCPEPCSLSPQFNLAGTNGIPDATYFPTRRDIAPRVGIAWRPMKSERFVVRSAYGIFYDVAIGDINILPHGNPPFENMAAYLQSPNCPGGLCTVQDLLAQTGRQSGVVQGNMIDPHFRDGYMQQWNLDLQYEVAPNWMIDLAYVGSKGTHLSNVIDRNQTNPLTGAPYGQFSSVLYVESSSASSYHSMQFRSERRVSHGLAFLAAYTWSRSIDDVSSVFAGSVGSGLPQNSQDLSADRGPSDFNATHRVSVSSVYDLPLRGQGAKGSAWNKALLDDWQASGIFSAQSGSPFTVVLAGSPTASAAAFGNPERPDLVGDPNRAGAVAANPTCVAPTQIRTPQNWFNQCAFASPATEDFGPAFGTEGRNALTGPPYADLDFSLSKSFAIRHESQRLQFRGESFNLLNHPNFDDPYHDFELATCGANNNFLCPTANFGAVLSSNAFGDKPPRQTQLSFKYVF
ncbi:MAG: carboxypeptidase-like regulatory domain-containing protein [Terracidiphilus sp.]